MYCCCIQSYQVVSFCSRVAVRCIVMLASRTCFKEGFSVVFLVSFRCCFPHLLTILYRRLCRDFSPLLCFSQNIWAEYINKYSIHFNCKYFFTLPPVPERIIQLTFIHPAKNHHLMPRQQQKNTSHIIRCRQVFVWLFVGVGAL